jgi:hypothetical protein
MERKSMSVREAKKIEAYFSPGSVPSKVLSIRTTTT